MGDSRRSESREEDGEKFEGKENFEVRLLIIEVCYKQLINNKLL